MLAPAFKPAQIAPGPRTAWQTPFHRHGPRAKLKLGGAQDEAEKQADRIAAQVMKEGTPTKANVAGFAEAARNRAAVRRALAPTDESERLQAPAEQEQVLPEVLEREIATFETGGEPLPPPLRADFEARLGLDLAPVRLHTDANAARLNEVLHAHAFTVGEHIAFNAGRFKPDTAPGRFLLAHELAHVAQQQGLGAAPVRRTVTPTPVARRNRQTLIGDGTIAHPGITLGELSNYVATQADWFSDPTLTATDRDMVWNTLRQLDASPALRSAARNLHLAEVAGLSPPERTLLDTFATGFDPAAQTVRLSTPAANLTEARDKGRAMRDLATFVPAPVMRVVIPESGITYLVAQAKVPELRHYYSQFRPTLETGQEWPHVQALLTATIAPNAALRGWVADLHIFSAATRNRLVTNVADFSRSHPVLLVLFSARDWNHAFLQAANMAATVLNPNNLALVIQGTTNLTSLTTRVNDVANLYGEREVIGFDIWTLSLRRGPGRLGQVVFAGHGSETSVEMAISGTAPVNVRNQYVRYSGESLDSATNTAHTQALIDTVLRRMDPAAARIVFAGCLVGSHEFPASLNLANLATAATTLRSHLASHPNLRDFVQARMAALGIRGNVQAARGSTPFSTFGVTSGGTAQLSLGWDPAIGGSAQAYVQNGSEPEGSLRAALETYADTRFGPATTTGWMRVRVTALAGDRHWYRTQTRSAFQIAVPASGNVNPARLLDLSHRVGNWLLAGWASSVNVGRLKTAVHTGEEATVYNGMLASSRSGEAHLPISVQEAWMAADATHVPTFAAALNATSLNRVGFEPLLSRPIVAPHLGTLLTTGSAPTRGQMLLALTIAVQDRAGMPAQVRSFLRAAAGGAATNAFPPALNVTNLLAGPDQLQVLQNIGLAPGTAATPSTSSPTAPPDLANIDLDRDSTNESFVSIARRSANVLPATVTVRARPAQRAAAIATLAHGAAVRVMGTMGAWSLIDAGGRTGFLRNAVLTP